MGRKIKKARARWLPKFDNLSIEFGEPIIEPVVTMYRNADYLGLSMIVIALFCAFMFTMASGMSIFLSRIG